MNKSVPTLLGILVLLVVAVLVVLIYNIKLTNQLGQGLTPTGTVGGEVLTGAKAPTEELAPAPGGTREGQAKAAAMPANVGKGEAPAPAGQPGRMGRGGMGRGGPGGGGPGPGGRGGG